MPLRGVKVLEFAGLAPGPFCGKILADFGATVTEIDKVAENHLNVLHHGKRTLGVNLKSAKGQALVRQLASKYDVILEPFRPGVMENLNLGPEVLCRDQPRLIYARLTGFGQTGRLAKRAGHDINYAAISGVLSMLGRQDEPPSPPVNILADFAGGGLMCALGICLALLERHRSGRGQVVDAAMVDGAAYVASWLFMSRSLPLWSKERGQNIIDGGAYYYNTYATKDGRYMSVGALEPQFFKIFKTRLGLPELSQIITNETEEAAAKALLQRTFLQKTQDDWARIFEDIDACVYPVVEWQQAMRHDHNKERESFRIEGEDVLVPKPAPRLSRTPGEVRPKNSNVNHTEDALAILAELNLERKELEQLVDERVLLLPKSSTKAAL